MSQKPTRRTVAKLLLAAPAAMAAVPLACQTATPQHRQAGPASAAEAKERQLLGKSVSELRKSVERLGRMTIPMGSEPAFAFAPLLPPPAAAAKK